MRHWPCAVKLQKRGSRFQRPEVLESQIIAGKRLMSRDNLTESRSGKRGDRSINQGHRRIENAAILFFKRKDISVEEVTTIRPDQPKQIELSFRNVHQAAMKIYRLDLLKFGLMQCKLGRITAINLAGMKPHHEQSVSLGVGNDFRDRTHRLELPLPLREQGAFVIVCRGENLYASGLVVVSPLSRLVQQNADSGRVHLSVKDEVDDSFVHDIHIRIIGSANDDFVSGDNDLGGLVIADHSLVIADHIRGNCTVIAAGQDDQDAFFR